MVISGIVQVFAKPWTMPEISFWSAIVSRGIYKLFADCKEGACRIVRLKKVAAG